MRSGLWLLVLCFGVGCVTPRSMALGMMAQPIGNGTEVGVFTGVGYSSITGPVVSTTNPSTMEVTNTQTANRAFAIPSFEANITKGFTDHVGLNVHVSPAGIQPGLKWTVNKSRVAHFAILPAIAMGYGSVQSVDFVAQSTGAQTEVNPRATTSFTFLGGLKLLVSHVSGFYAGAGYDLVFQRSNSSSAPSATADRVDAITETLTHQIMAAVGFSLSFGAVSARPEIAFAVNPALSQVARTRVGGNDTGEISRTGGSGWALLIGFSIAVASAPGKGSTAAPEEDDEAESGGNEEGEEEAPQKSRPRKGPRKKLPDDDEDDTPRRKKSDSDDE